jgi:hypothetical protein
MSSWGGASAVPDGSFRRLVAESDLGELRRQHPAWLLQHADHLAAGGEHPTPSLHERAGCTSGEGADLIAKSIN